MKFIDTHTHVNIRAFEEDAEQVIKRAHDAEVAVVNVGTQIDTSRQAVEMLQKFPENVYAVVGLHPSHTYSHNFVDEEEVVTKTREEHFDASLYKELASDSRVIGIGECGLDYYRLPDDRDREEIKQLQRATFDAQIKLALELDKTLCVHCRPSDGTEDAYEEMLEIISKVKNENPLLRFEIHCFTGSAKMAKKFAELGGYIGLNGILTFDKSPRSREVVETLSLENIILETDAPYLTPKSNRGKRNEPAYLPEVAEKIAEWKGVSADEVARQTTANAKRLFKIS